MTPDLEALYGHLPKVSGTLAARHRLKGKQAPFCVEYVKDFDGTAAARRAGYSPANAALMATTNLKLTNVQACVQELTLAKSRATGVTAERVVGELAAIGFSDPRRAFTGEGHARGRGKLLFPDEWPDDVAFAIKAVKVKLQRNVADGSLEETVELQFWEKTKALEMLAKHTGVLADRPPDLGGQPAALDAVRSRALDLLERLATRLPPGAQKRVVAAQAPGTRALLEQRLNTAGAIDAEVVKDGQKVRPAEGANT